MTNKFVPVNIKPETRELLRRLKGKSDIPHYRIIADSLAMYARVHEKPVKFTMVKK